MNMFQWNSERERLRVQVLQGTTCYIFFYFFSYYGYVRYITSPELSPVSDRIPKEKRGRLFLQSNRGGLTLKSFPYNRIYALPLPPGCFGQKQLFGDFQAKYWPN